MKVRHLASAVAALSVVRVGIARSQASAHSVAGIVKDGASGQGLGGALVDMIDARRRLTTRTTQSGAFQFSNVPSGEYRLSVRRIGFAEFDSTLSVAESDVRLAITMLANSHRLDTVRVRATTMGISGVVGSAATLQALSGATVQIVGADQLLVTDSVGKFFAALRKAGTYVVRVRHEGYEDQVFSVIVRPDQVVETSALLERGARAGLLDADVLWREFDDRLRWGGMNSAVITADDIRDDGGTLRDILSRSRSMALKGLRLGPSICLFVNGEATPGWPLDAIDPDRVEAVEVYTKKGDITNTLARRWPPGVPCGDGSIPTVRGSSAATATTVAYAAVWLRL